MLQALADQGLLPAGLSPRDADRIDWTAALAHAVHLYLARTPSALLMLQLDDLADEPHQANLPGSTTEYPNWRWRTTRELGELLDDGAIREELAAVSAARMGRPSTIE